MLTIPNFFITDFRYGVKAGFSVTQGSVSSVINIGRNSTIVNTTSLDNTTVLAKKIHHLKKSITRTQRLTKPHKMDITAAYFKDYYKVPLSLAVVMCIITVFRTYKYGETHHKPHTSRRMKRILAIASLILVLAFSEFHFPEDYKQEKDDVSQIYMNKELPGAQTIKRAHIIYAADKEQIIGVYASICSILKNTLTPDAITFHLFTLQNDNALHDGGVFYAFQDYVKSTEAILEIHNYSISDVQPFINTKFAQFSSQGNLTAPSNYVRFIISNKLPQIDLCLWIDADTVVWGDIVPFMNDRDHTKAVSAFVREKADIDDDIREKLIQRGVDLAPREPTFNAGILVINLKVWREMNAIVQLANICKINDRMTAKLKMRIDLRTDQMLVADEESGE